MAQDPPQFLLLLPPGPNPPTASALKAAFGDTISQVLKEVASHSSESKQAAVLEIALALPHLINCEKTPRTNLYDQTQSYLAAVYKLICTIAAKDNVNVEDVDGVDVRILLVNWTKDLVVDGPSVTNEQPYGPVVSLQTLARSKRPWQFAFGVESETGEAMVQSFIAAKGTEQEVQRVISGPVMQSTDSQPRDPSKETGGNAPGEGRTTHPLHPHVAVGGTFDHIHIGHKLLLTMTIFAVDEDNANGQKFRSATIGITGDQLLVNKKHAEVLESWHDRYSAVMTFINALIDFNPSKPKNQIARRNDSGPNGKSIDTTYPNSLTIKCTEIQDPFGPTITEKGISALVISAETRAGGKAVNDKRAEKGWKGLDIFEVDVLDAEEGEEEEKGDRGVKEGFEITNDSVTVAKDSRSFKCTCLLEVAVSNDSSVTIAKEARRFKHRLVPRSYSPAAMMPMKPRFFDGSVRLNL